MFNVQDGHGFSIARKAGLKLALLTGRSSEAVRRRAGELQVNGMLEGVEDKGAGVIALLEKLSVAPENACYIGDDLVDIPAMKKTGFPVAVVNAVAEVKQEAAWVTTRSGGDGAFRTGAQSGMVEVDAFRIDQFRLAYNLRTLPQRRAGQKL